mmetsp:Transcript_17497/g.67860  ORF Transcript_17497/g.67860 Transcript_17497/m.67860 type:complete len:218 (+) Transcript_17497:2988-3641(+)
MLPPLPGRAVGRELEEILFAFQRSDHLDLDVEHLHQGNESEVVTLVAAVLLQLLAVGLPRNVVEERPQSDRLAILGECAVLQLCGLPVLVVQQPLHDLVLDVARLLLQCLGNGKVLASVELVVNPLLYSVKTSSKAVLVRLHHHVHLLDVDIGLAEIADTLHEGEEAHLAGEHLGTNGAVLLGSHHLPHHDSNHHLEQQADDTNNAAKHEECPVVPG